MGGTIPGPMCSSRCGPDWIDDGTSCRARCETTSPLGFLGAPTAEELARQTILDVLTDRAMGRISFRIERFAVRPRSYARVAEAIRAGRIAVEYNWDVGTSAYYYPYENKFEVGFTAATFLTRRALVAHECTHAAFDVEHFARATVETSEAAAFVAECVFARIHSPQPDDPDYRLSSDNEAKDRIYEAAWEIGGTILRGRTPAAADYESLKRIVRRHPDYRHGRSLSGWSGI